MYIFYDSHCPLCRIEMRHLTEKDKHAKITLVDIQAPDFTQRFPDLDWDALNRRIHVQLDDGTYVSGLDATYAAWKAVGMGWLYAPLRWPVIRIVADWGYEWFAKNRYSISYWLTGQKRGCDTCGLNAVDKTRKEGEQR